jgi:hypothetical protein
MSKFDAAHDDLDNYGRDDEGCPICGSIYHVHCSRGCALCDDPKNPHPRYASRFCAGCKRSLCQQCFEDHICDGGKQ